MSEEHWHQNMKTEQFNFSTCSAGSIHLLKDRNVQTKERESTGVEGTVTNSYKITVIVL